MNQEKLDIARKNLEVTNSIAEEFKKEKLEDNFDPEIFDFVVTLNALGLRTVGSCQGHPETSNYLPVIIFSEKNNIIFSEDFISISNTTSKQDILDVYYSTLNIQKKLKDFLNEFYKDRKTPMKYRFNISNHTFCSAVLTFSFELISTYIKNNNERSKINKIALKEVHDFNEFLKAKIK